MADTVGAPSPTGAATIRSLIPARIDRLSWSPFHTRMTTARDGRSRRDRPSRRAQSSAPLILLTTFETPWA
jgi:hypothetical protein